MKISLTKKLSFAFLIAILSSLIITNSISNYVIEKNFTQYLIDEHDSKLLEVQALVENIYVKNNSFSNFKGDEITRQAIFDELYIEVKDNSGNVIYSSGDSHLLQKNNTVTMMNGKSRSMHGMNASIDLSKYTEENFTLTNDDSSIGTLTIGYWGTSYLSTAAITFKNALTYSFVISLVITALLGFTISKFLSKQLGTPLINLTSIANKMRSGQLDVRSNINTSTIEINDLSDSINYLAQTLNHQEMLRKKLTSDMSHEIRTPLTTLKTHVEALIDGIWQPTPERLNIIYDELERLSKLVANLQNLSKVEQATVAINKSNVNVSAELLTIVESFTPLYNKKSYKIDSSIMPDVYCYIDKDNLKQIMHNLLANAYKYLKPHGFVKISLSINEDSIIVEVEDNGIGISEDDLPHIFERFYRSDLSRNKKTGGSGLGLSISKALVIANGGTITVSSKINCGTKFLITFPK